MAACITSTSQPSVRRCDPVTVAFVVNPSQFILNKSRVPVVATVSEL